MVSEKTKKYIEAIGRRKTSTARVRLESASKSEALVNGRTLSDYFPTAELRHVALYPLTVVPAEKFRLSVHVSGGGIHSQAEALAHGLARALNLKEPANRAPLKKAKLLTRDSRAKERRKFGLKKARKAPQWSKR